MDLKMIERLQQLLINRVSDSFIEKSLPKLIKEWKH